MPDIIPFRAVRAASDKAAHLISRSYQDYDDKELKSLLKYNPYSFLHILNPGYKFNQEISGEERFSLVRNRFLEFIEEQYLIRDEQPAFYLYQNIDPHHSYTGFIAGTSCHDYRNNRIKKHEDTLQHKEVLFKEYLKVVGFNAEPVLMTYPDQDHINMLIERIQQDSPDYDFSTSDKNRHKIWVIDETEMVEKIQSYFKEISHIYIADGHHRSASSVLLADEMGDVNDSYQYFMSFLIPESQLNIYEFNRMVTDLNGLNKEELLIKLDQYFRIQNRGLEIYKPTKKHHFSMYLDGDYYSLYLRKDLVEINSALDDLDSQMLYDLILKPILGIGDLRTDSRLQYSYGKHDLLRLKKRVDQGEFAVGFGMFPATVEQMKSIADADLRMPPKSTFIRPKLPSGLLIYEF